MKTKFNPSIFREYDIRGIAGKDLSPDLAKTLGLAYTQFLNKTLGPCSKKRRIAVGRDCRLTGKEYSTALISGLLAGGVDVVEIGVCPTPLTYFSIFHLNLDGGIMVTGSHNPSDYNGFKICVEKNTLHGHDIQELRKIMEGSSLTPAPVSGEKSEYSIIPAYLDYVVKHTGPFKNKKVVLDAGNGTAGSVAPPLFEKLGATVIPLFCELDGRFPNHHPDPTVPANLKDLIAAVKKEKADFGVAFDGDSDRIGVVDENGRILFGDELMVVFSRDVLKNKPGSTIISEVKSSYRLYDDIAKNGGNPLMWKTGHSLIKAKMKETRASLAGEMSGHIFFADRYFGFDDAIYAAVRFYEIACKTSGPASSLLQGLPQTVNTPEIRIDCTEELKFSLVEKTKKELPKDIKINDIDGIRADFGDGWGLIRASNTQPVLVLRFEAVTTARLEEIRNEMQSALTRAATSVGHPQLQFESSGHH